MRKYRIAVIPGDGVGPEIVSETLRLLNEVGFNAEYIHINAGLKYYGETGKPIEDNAIDTIKNCHATLKGPIATPPTPKFNSVNVWLRKSLNLYVNVRPFKSWRGISVKDNVDIVLLRENLEGLYSGIEFKCDSVAVTLRVISKAEVKKVCRFAFEYAMKNGRGKVTVVHKANILRETDGLFRQVFYEIARNYPTIKHNEVIVDAAAYKLILAPEEFDVLVTPNLYGDILSDLIAGLIGSIGLCGSALIGDELAVFEPIHGVAWDIAGRGIANPIGEIHAAILMLKWLSERYSDEKLYRLAKSIEEATRGVVEDKGVKTLDLGGNASTKDVVDAIIRELESET